MWIIFGCARQAESMRRLEGEVALLAPASSDVSAAVGARLAALGASVAVAHNGEGTLAVNGRLTQSNNAGLVVC
jgi:hypothetical protein